jgi:hypothetical protein
MLLIDLLGGILKTMHVFLWNVDLVDVLMLFLEAEDCILIEGNFPVSFYMVFFTYASLIISEESSRLRQNWACLRQMVERAISQVGSVHWWCGL